MWHSWGEREKDLETELERKVEIEAETDTGIEVEIFMILLAHRDSDHIFKTFYPTIFIVHGRQLKKKINKI